jgi:alkaline phosphatase D
MDVDPVQFLARRANAYQAYYEMMPLRQTSLPSGPNMRLYRPITFGQLAQFSVLDTRQYRTRQPHGGGRHEIDDAALSQNGTMMGVDQMQWLQSSLSKSSASWNVLAQQVLMAMVDLEPGKDKRYSMEKWAGYAYERVRLMQFLDDHKIANPVVLTGDIHSNWVNDVRVDDRRAETPVIATEFAGTSISSGGNGTAKPDGLAEKMAENPCVRFHNAERGYVACTVTQDSWRSDFRVVRDVSHPGAPIRTRASFVIESGQAGAKPA